MNLYKILTTLLFGISSLQASQEENQDNSGASSSSRQLVCDLKLRPYTNFLQGENLFMRPLFPGDHVSLRPIYTDPEQMKYFGEGKTLSLIDIENRIIRQTQTNNMISPPYYTLAIITQGGVAGQFFVVFPNLESDPKDDKSEIGYCLSPSFGGRGLTTEAGHLVLDSFCGPFFATVHPNNVASTRVLEKLGFKADLTCQNVPKFGSIRNYYVLERKNR